jgi:hypothetical protein
MSQPILFALLIPLTSAKSTPEATISRLTMLAKNLATSRSVEIQFQLYLGIDIGDVVLDQQLENKNYVPGDIFMRFGLQTEVMRFPLTTPSKICLLWREMAQRAYVDGCHYYVLLGDDVEVNYVNPSLLSTSSGLCASASTALPLSWPDLIHQKFQLMPIPGFGCLSLHDLGAPGFPTFPVLSRVHFDIFSGKVVPDDFINQDGDPYLWELYRRWNCSTFLPEVTIVNEMGGVQLNEKAYIEPRYERVHINWKGEVLSRGVERVKTWIVEQHHQKHLLKESLVMDIIVPSYRVNKQFLAGIINVPIPAECVTMIIIIVDDPNANIDWLRDIEGEVLHFSLQLIVRLFFYLHQWFYCVLFALFPIIAYYLAQSPGQYSRAKEYDEFGRFRIAQCGHE